MFDDFKDVLRVVESDDKGKYDFTVPFKNIDLDLDENRTFRIRNNEGTWVQRYTVTEHGFRQIMNKIGIPSSYASKTPPTLLKPHFDYWKNQVLRNDPDKKVLIRARKSYDINDDRHVIRAVLSNSYSTFDNKDVVSLFQDAVNGINYRIQDCKITEDMFNARVLLTDICIDAGLGPDGSPNAFYAGVHIVNGETGNYNARLELIIFEKWCSNGAIRSINNKPLLSRKHIGDIDLKYEFKTALKNAIEEGGKQVQLLVQSKQEIVKDPLIVLGNLMDRNPRIFTPNMKEQIKEDFEMRPINSKYGIVSAFTQAARKLPYEERLELEKFAGKVLETKLTV